MSNKPLTYKDAGVDIDAGNELVEQENDGKIFRFVIKKVA